MTKRPTIVAIFAHPDDESFGPAGTIAKLSQSHDVYLITVTHGEHGGKLKNLAEIRTQELRQASQILGIKEVHQLNFEDGTLNNLRYHDLAQELETKLKQWKPETLITFENLGLTGHLDHIAVSMITCFLFKKLSFIKKVMLYCLPEDQTNEASYFVYFPPGYKKADISHIENVSDTWTQKIAAIKCHQSQATDVNHFLKRAARLPQQECFLVKTK